MAIVILIAISTSIAINMGNYLTPVIAVAAGMILLTMGRRKVKGVLADERDYSLAGTAARYTITIFALAMMVAIFGLMALKDKNPEFMNIATLLAYLVCAIMIINSLIFRFLKAKESSDKKNFFQNLKHYLPFIILAFILAMILAVASLRMFTPEDEWICVDGNWTKHGNPSAAMPLEACR